MLYAILCYDNEAAVSAWTAEEDAAVMDRLWAVQEPMVQAGRMGPVARLLPTTTAATLRKAGHDPLVIDGPFAETKEQLLGFYVVDCENLDEVTAFAKQLAAANPGLGCFEIRPVGTFRPGTLPS